jgi:transposase
VARIDIADATELAHRRGKRRKNDPNDALDIARRLARGECPLGFIADPMLMQLCKLGRHWRQLSRLLARSKHALKSMLNAANLRGPIPLRATHRPHHTLEPGPRDPKSQNPKSRHRKSCLRRKLPQREKELPRR